MLRQTVAEASAEGFLRATNVPFILALVACATLDGAAATVTVTFSALADPDGSPLTGSCIVPGSTAIPASGGRPQIATADDLPASAPATASSNGVDANGGLRRLPKDPRLPTS
jgi:hypothetical protein